jgi:hypothetical protein
MATVLCIVLLPVIGAIPLFAAVVIVFGFDCMGNIARIREANASGKVLFFFVADRNRQPRLYWFNYAMCAVSVPLALASIVLLIYLIVIQF